MMSGVADLVWTVGDTAEFWTGCDRVTTRVDAVALPRWSSDAMGAIRWPDRRIASRSQEWPSGTGGDTD